MASCTLFGPTWLSSGSCSQCKYVFWGYLRQLLQVVRSNDVIYESLFFIHAPPVFLPVTGRGRSAVAWNSTRKEAEWGAEEKTNTWSQMHLPAPVLLCFPLIVTHHQKLSANRSRWLNLDVRAVDTDTVRTVFAGDERLEEGNSEHHEYESFRFRHQRENGNKSRRRKNKNKEWSIYPPNTNRLFLTMVIQRTAWHEGFSRTDTTLLQQK